MPRPTKNGCLVKRFGYKIILKGILLLFWQKILKFSHLFCQRRKVSFDIQGQKECARVC